VRRPSPPSNKLPARVSGGAAAGRALPRPAPPPPAAAAPPPPLPPTDFTVDAAPPGDLGAVLVGRQVLYWWPDDGWQRGTVARLCPRVAFLHVVAYMRQMSALRGTVTGTALADSVLDSASYGARWARVLLSPGPAAGVVAGSWAGRLEDPNFKFSSSWSVAAREWPGLGRQGHVTETVRASAARSGPTAAVP
jgi:hypothetical protein